MTPIASAGAPNGAMARAALSSASSKGSARLAGIRAAFMRGRSLGATRCGMHSCCPGEGLARISLDEEFDAGVTNARSG